MLSGISIPCKKGDNRSLFFSVSPKIYDDASNQQRKLERYCEM